MRDHMVLIPNRYVYNTTPAPKHGDIAQEEVKRRPELKEQRICCKIMVPRAVRESIPLKTHQNGCIKQDLNNDINGCANIDKERYRAINPR